MDSPPSLPTVGGEGTLALGKGAPEGQEEPPKTFELESWRKVIPDGGQRPTEARRTLGKSQSCGHRPPRPKPLSWEQLCCWPRAQRLGEGIPRERL